MKQFTFYLLIVPVMAILNSCGHDTMEDVDLCANPPLVTLRVNATVSNLLAYIESDRYPDTNSKSCT